MLPWGKRTPHRHPTPGHPTLNPTPGHRPTINLGTCVFTTHTKFVSLEKIIHSGRRFICSGHRPPSSVVRGACGVLAAAAGAVARSAFALGAAVSPVEKTFFHNAC